MTEQALHDWESRIESRVERTLSSRTDRQVPIANEAVMDCEDRWFGRLLVASHGALSDDVDHEAVLPAAAAVELLRGYSRIRLELLAQLADDVAHSLTLDPTSALLAGDFLFSLAYSELSEAAAGRTEAGFDALADVSRSIAETFASNYDASATPTARCRKLITGTAGPLGAGAAAIGAVLAGVDDSHRDRFATAGRGFGVSRQMRRTLDADAKSASIAVPLHVDEAELREYARRQRAEADQALRRLPAHVDTSRLRTLLTDRDESAV